MIDFETVDLHNKDPMTIFTKWYKEAGTIPANDLPETMTMATTRRDHHPAARTLLMRGYDETGFQIYGDYTSPKSKDLEFQNRTALVFVWSFIPEGGSEPVGTRQVRVEGVAEKLSQEQNEKYFENEQVSYKVLGATQVQSQRMTPRRQEEVVRLTRERLKRIREDPNYRLEMPEKYGGYHITPRVFDFYQSNPNSLTTRIRFSKKEDMEGVPENLESLPEGVYAGADDWFYEFLES